MGDRCVDTFWLSKACPRSALLLYSEIFVQDTSYVLGTSVSNMLVRTTAKQLLRWASSSTRWTSGLMEGNVHSGRGYALFFVGPVLGRFRCASGYVLSEENCAHIWQLSIPLDSTRDLRLWFSDRWATSNSILDPSRGFLSVTMGLA